jgi:hypothetical protein
MNRFAVSGICFAQTNGPLTDVATATGCFASTQVGPGRDTLPAALAPAKPLAGALVAKNREPSKLASGEVEYLIHVKSSLGGEPTLYYTQRVNN